MTCINYIVVHFNPHLFSLSLSLSLSVSLSLSLSLSLAQAEKEYGKDKLKIYRSSFTPMYHAITTRKTKCSMKLITVLPEEKVNLNSLYLFPASDQYG